MKKYQLLLLCLVVSFNTPTPTYADDDDGIKLGKTEFDAHWPPKKEDGSLYKETQEDLDEWYKYVALQNAKYEEYQKIRKEVEDKYGGASALAAINANAPRAYPYCVDGLLPHMDRFDHDASGNATPKAYCDDVDNTKCLDRDLENFIPYFTASQPLQGPIIASITGTPNIIRLNTDGSDDGPYIRTITFSKIFSPDPPLGIKWPRPDGTPELPFWIHIIVKSREPLEGLFLQAIGFPMGLPFGNFHDDFDCAAGGLSDNHIKVTDYKKHEILPDTGNIIVPCKYSHGNNNGDMFPNVYAYGGRKRKGSDGNPWKWKKHTEFRVNFRWSSTHCNLKARVQFLVLGVRSFKSNDFEAFLTANYKLNQNNADGSPPPILLADSKDDGWAGQMQCNENNVVTAPTDQSQVVLEFDSTSTSGFPIPYDGEYDNCIKNDEELDNFFADDLSKTVNNDFDSTLSKDDEILVNALKALSTVWTVSRKMAQICPPANICLNEQETEDDDKLKYDDNGHPTNADSFYKKINDKIGATVPKCNINVPELCLAPNKTIPILSDRVPGVTGAPDDDDDEDDADASKSTKDALSDGGTQFSRKFTEEFYRKGAKHFRRARGTHVWCMTLAWFILMAIGCFTARYYKESGGINANTGNSFLGLGWWIWVHAILFLLSLTFMWIGLLETAKFRQKPVSCNLLQDYQNGEYSLKNFCRWNKRAVRKHQKAGTTAVVLYHIALVISWARPVRSPKILCTKWRFPLRKFFLLVHVVCAYFGQFICILSIIFLFLSKGPGICKSIPTVLMLTELVSIIFFAAGWIIQCLEDVQLGRLTRSVFPVPEAIEPADNSPCYCTKVIVVVLSVIVHLIMFGLLVILVVNVYTKPGTNSTIIPSLEALNGVFGKCHVTSSATELESSMNGYYFRKNAEASDG